MFSHVFCLNVTLKTPHRFLSWLLQDYQTQTIVNSFLYLNQSQFFYCLEQHEALKYAQTFCKSTEKVIALDTSVVMNQFRTATPFTRWVWSKNDSSVFNIKLRFLIFPAPELVEHILFCGESNCSLVWCLGCFLFVSRSPLAGLFFRTLTFLEHDIKPVFVFDGKPPVEKIPQVRTTSGMLLSGVVAEPDVLFVFLQLKKRAEAAGRSRPLCTGAGVLSCRI